MWPLGLPTGFLICSTKKTHCRDTVKMRVTNKLYIPSFLSRVGQTNGKQNSSARLFFWPSDSVYCCCSVTKSCPTLCDPMACSTPGSSVLYYLLQFAQTHVHRVGDAIQPSHPLSSPSPPAFNLSQHQGLFQWADFSNQVANALVLQPQHQLCQWIFWVVFL